MSRFDILRDPAGTAGQSDSGSQITGTLSPGRPAPQVSRAHAVDPSRRPTAFPEEQLISLTSPHSFEAEQYRTLSHLVASWRNSNGHQVLAVSSAGIGDGKTMTTLNLAGALAQSRDSRVLLIDADLRCPAVASQLRLADPSRPGLADALRGRPGSLSAALHRLPEWNLSVLATARAEHSAYELLKSANFARLMEEARREFEFVLIDCPPLLAVPDCRVIERVVDGFLLVVSADRTPRKLLAEALNVLSLQNVIGIVFNRDVRPLSGYYGYYGRSYGRQNGPGTP